MKQKHAFVVYSGEGETGRVFHAMVHAKQAYARGDDVQLFFAAEGTYWPERLADSQHQMHPLFEELLGAEIIAGACSNCANAFGHADGAKQAVGLIKGPEASYGQIDILGMADKGYRVWLF